MLLLDSQAALWVLDDSPRLGPKARDAITAASRVHVSAATVWDLTIKAMLGKLAVPAKLASRLTDQGMELLSVTAEHAEGIRQFRNWRGTTRWTGSSSLKPARRAWDWSRLTMSCSTSAASSSSTRGCSRAAESLRICSEVSKELVETARGSSRARR